MNRYRRETWVRHRHRRRHRCRRRRQKRRKNTTRLESLQMELFNSWSSFANLNENTSSLESVTVNVV